MFLTWKSVWVGTSAGSVVKKSPADSGDARDMGSYLNWEDPQDRTWQHTPVFLPGKFHG